MNGNTPNRSNWSKPLTFVTVLSVVAVIIGYLAGGGTEIEGRLFFQNSAGGVLFDHNMHSDTAETCAHCHHELLKAEQSVVCSECHDEDLAADDFSHSELKEIHGQDCSRCHLQDDDKEPASCRECHVEAPQEENTPSDCSRCHDDDYTPDMVSHDEYLEVAEHDCLGCHSPASVSETYHQTCTNCHLESAPNRFGADEGGALCGACHLR